jgi:hypothetical protein
VSGSLAVHLDADAEVTLHRPPPLETPLVVQADADGVRLLTGDELVASARAISLAERAPAAVTVAEAKRAQGAYGGENFIGGCFSCGRDRTPGDGLCLYPGPLSDRPDTLAVHWSPDRTLAAPDGTVAEPIVWAALDCPSGWTHIRTGAPALLGRIAARVAGEVHAGTDYVVVAAPTGAEGRKLYAQSALYDDAGRLLAQARATWIRIDQR